MKESNRSISFYVEALMLILVFVVVLVTLARLFGASISNSQSARTLTDAVTLAQNAAEAVSASSDARELARLLAPEGGAKTDDTQVEVWYNEDLEPDDAGVYLVSATWQPGAEDPRLVHSRIRVLRDGQQVYDLDASVYVRGGIAS